MRENVIEQLEEEIKAKERLIYEQGHLINILENDHNETKFDADSVTSDSEITIIERHCTSISPCKSDSNSSEDCLRYRDRLEQAMVDREKLELQNEQLLRQWEEALEYVSKIQKQLQEEIKKNISLRAAVMDLENSQRDSVNITRGCLQIISVLAIFIAYYLYSL